MRTFESTEAKDLNENNLVDLELRAKSQFIYALGGALAFLILGVVVVVLLARYLSIQNSFLIGTAFLFGVVILLLSAFDIKAKVRGINSHRSEQNIMGELYKKYQNSSSPGESFKLSGQADEEIKRQESIRRRKPT